MPAWLGEDPLSGSWLVPSLCALMWWKGLGISLEPQFSLCKTEGGLLGRDERDGAGKVPGTLDAPSECQLFFLAFQRTSSDESAPIWKLVLALWLSFLGVLCTLKVIL